MSSGNSSLQFGLNFPSYMGPGGVLAARKNPWPIPASLCWYCSTRGSGTPLLHLCILEYHPQRWDCTRNSKGDWIRNPIHASLPHRTQKLTGKWDGVMPRSAMWVTGESLVPNWLTWLSLALPWHTSTREWTCTYHVLQHIDVHTSDYTSCHNTHWLLSYYFKLRKHVVLKWVN